MTASSRQVLMTKTGIYRGSLGSETSYLALSPVRRRRRGEV